MSVWLWAGVLLLGLLGGCAQAAATEVAAAPTPAPTIEPEDTLRIVYWQAPSLLNPHLSNTSRDLEVSRIAYEPLASFDRDGALVPFLAAEIPALGDGVAADGRSVTWRLRQDVRWADGEPFTADDVRFTYQYITNPAVGSTSAGLYAGVADVEVIDPYTVRILFRDVTPAWDVPFVGFQGMVLPEHVFAAYNGANAAAAPANQLPLGTGPYYAVANEPQEVLFFGDTLVQTNRILFMPNPEFRQAVAFDAVEIRGGGSSEEAARLVLQVDEADFAGSLTVTDALTELEGLGNGRLVVNFGSRVQRLALNQTDPNRETAAGERASLQFPHPFLSDLRVRQAISLAIDRERIAALYGVAGKPTSNNLVVPPQFASPNTAYAFDLDAAAALLDEAGWVDSDGDGIRDKDGVALRLEYLTYIDTIVQATQDIIKLDLAKIGVFVDKNPVAASVFYAISPEPNPDNGPLFYADMAEYFIGMVSPDPASYLVYWTCGQIPQMANNWTAGLNFERWCNAEYDALYQQASTELDPARRRDLIIQMNDMLIAQVVMIPLVHVGEVSAVGADIAGIDPTPWDSILWNIKDWRRSGP
ncbi:MAG: peptide ABC transporter substrate-binding protein [Anaerolineales bacterium]|nr:peptide ABC transporter substrate-binding protein [Anaerolineales bacterium]